MDMDVFMTKLLRNGLVPCTLMSLGVAGLLAQGEVDFQPHGGEYGIIGARPGDEILADVGLTPNGGYIVWQDNVTDGDGTGISARMVDGNFNGLYAPFRVNQAGAGAQENPRVAMLSDGGTVITWQGGPGANPHIFARFIRPQGVFATGDILVSSFEGAGQRDPAVAALAGGGAVIIWSSYEQDGDLQGVFGQRFSSEGAKLGGEFQVNQNYFYNQRSPDVAALPSGGFITVWVDEAYRGVSQASGPQGYDNDGAGGGERYDVDVIGRVYGADGSPRGDSFKINSSALTCGTPRLSTDALGGYAVVWSGRSKAFRVAATQDQENWDIYSRVFAADGSAVTADAKVNEHAFGDQFLPRVACVGSEHLVVWSSLKQDGSFEGVYGRTLNVEGVFSGPETLVNTTTLNRQLYPCVSSDRDRRFLVVWSSFFGGLESFELAAQRFATAPVLSAPSAPFASPLNQNRITVTWPVLGGFSVKHYQLFVDGSETPILLQDNRYAAEGFLPGSTHTFALAYNLVDGRQSPLSGVTTARTWGEDANFDGLPDDWQGIYWPGATSGMPPAWEDSDGDGASNLKEFLAGTDPMDENSVLRITLTDSGEGLVLGWTTQPGCIYQVQQSDSVRQWTNQGGERFAQSTVDAVSIEAGDNLLFYRVIRIR